ncbi:FAD binding domain-containing protein [Pseudonocardia sp.]|uniref:FAD binding domain-containing protein n=1 Tax=Pseudonocardia sp. TaxID=60912 RepID=UPI002612D311|nr:FAD binding domain-containing protein [Pseudonocardia sp.]
MIPNRFSYHAPSSADEVARTLGSDPEGCAVLGGGTWLIAQLNRGQRVARHVVDLRRAGLREVERHDGRIRIGATATYADLIASDLVAADCSLLAAMAARITGGRQLHHQGTFAGSLAYARPASDAPAASLALSATMLVQGPGGTRAVPAEEFFVDAHRTTMAPDEFLRAVDVPVHASAGSGYVKIKATEGSWPVATAAAVVELDRDGRCRRACAAVGGVTAVPFRLPVQTVLEGRRVDADALAEVSRMAGDAITDPWSDVLASGEYRRAVAPVVARRALAAAVADAEATADARKG